MRLDASAAHRPSLVRPQVVLQIERGGSPLEVEVGVQDLHAVSPSCFLEIGHAVLHGLSYQMARNYRLATGQVRAWPAQGARAGNPSWLS